MTVENVDYTLVVKFNSSKEFSGGSIKADFAQSVDLDMDAKTITIQSKQNARRVVIYDSAYVYNVSVVGLKARNHRFYIEKTSTGEYHGTATIGGEEFTLNVYFN